MAEATVTHVERPVVTKKLVKVVTLVLTEEEAQTLQTLFNFIGGDPQVSRRRHVDAIHKALRKVLGWEYDQSDINTLKRSIWFNDEVKAQ